MPINLLNVFAADNWPLGVAAFMAGILLSCCSAICTFYACAHRRRTTEALRTVGSASLETPKDAEKTAPPIETAVAVGTERPLVPIPTTRCDAIPISPSYSITEPTDPPTTPAAMTPAADPQGPMLGDIWAPEPTPALTTVAPPAMITGGPTALALPAPPVPFNGGQVALALPAPLNVGMVSKEVSPPSVSNLMQGWSFIYLISKLLLYLAQVLTT